MTDPSSARHRGWVLAWYVIGVLFMAFIIGSQGGGQFQWGWALFALVLLPFGLVFGYRGYLNRWFGRRIADSLTGFGSKPTKVRAARLKRSAAAEPAPVPATPARTRTPDGYRWRPEVSIPPTYFSTHPAPMDWSGFIQSMAIRVEEALGPGCSVFTDGYALLLTHDGKTRRVELGGTLRAVGADAPTSATLACTRILEAAQAFKIEQLGRPWPTRADAVVDELIETTLVHPLVSFKNFELRMAYADELGPVLELQPIPLIERHPEPDGPVRLA